MSEASTAQDQQSKLAICASFTAEPLEGPLRFWLGKLGLDFELEFAPYAQVFQQLLDPGSLLHTNRRGLNVLLVRPEDWGREKAVGAADIAAHTRELEAALAGFVAKTAVPLMVGVIPASPNVPEDLAPVVDEAVSNLRSQVAELAGCTIVGWDETLRYRPSAIHDALQEELGHIPFTREMFAALATTMARRIHAWQRPAHKVLVLDCDNTLWRGVVGEEGPAGLILEPGFEQLHRFAIEQQAQGTLICLCSKNAEADVRAAFEERTDFPLRLEHTVANRINWEPKASNLASLASELNLGLDSFVFVDDNPVECASVRAALPQVVTLELSSVDRVSDLVDHLWAFDRLKVTQEDRQRTVMVQQNSEREQSLQQSQSIEEFLDGLELEIDFSSPSEEEWARVAQLTVRTNQFNFTTRRRTEAEVRAAADAGHELSRVRVKDRFGDYGIVGVLIFREEAGELLVDTFLVSCRVLGRGVEHAMIRRLGERAAEMGLDHVRLPFLGTEKNEPALAFIEQVAGDFRHGAGDETAFVIPREFAAEIQHRPGQDAEEVVAAQQGTKQPAAPKAGRGEAPKWQLYSEIAHDLSTAGQVVAAVEQSQAAGRPLAQPAEAPATETEQRVLAIWQRLFRIQDLGVLDSYFDLGGTSLLAVQLFSDIESEFSRRLPLTTILELGTVRALAAELGGTGAATAESVRGAVCLRQGSAGEDGPKLFLVHDGDGEVLLYRNLAGRVPAEMSVFGLMPKEEGEVPLAHARIEAMASHYVEQIRQEQPEGPYYLGGMCAGGTLAFEIAVQLEQAGAEIGLVAIMDAAAPRARKRPGLLASRRWARFADSLRGKGSAREPEPEAPMASGELESSADPAPPAGRLIGLARAAVEKLSGLVRYEVSHRLEASRTRGRFRALRAALEAGGELPAEASYLSVRDIYDLAESDYLPGRLHSDRVLLLRATEGDKADEPYVRLYADPDLGWQRYASLPIRIADVQGGHASMLQEPHVEDLAGTLTALLPASPSPSEQDS